MRVIRSSFKDMLRKLIRQWLQIDILSQEIQRLEKQLTSVSISVIEVNDVEEEIVLVFRNKQTAKEFIVWLKKRFIFESKYNIFS